MSKTNNNRKKKPTVISTVIVLKKIDFDRYRSGRRGNKTKKKASCAVAGAHAAMSPVWPAAFTQIFGFPESDGSNLQSARASWHHQPRPQRLCNYRQCQKWEGRSSTAGLSQHGRLLRFVPVDFPQREREKKNTVTMFSQRQEEKPSALWRRREAAMPDDTFAVCTPSMIPKHRNVNIRQD